MPEPIVIKNSPIEFIVVGPQPISLSLFEKSGRYLKQSVVLVRTSKASMELIGVAASGRWPRQEIKRIGHSSLIACVSSTTVQPWMEPVEEKLLAWLRMRNKEFLQEPKGFAGLGDSSRWVKNLAFEALGIEDRAIFRNIVELCDMGAEEARYGAFFSLHPGISVSEKRLYQAEKIFARSLPELAEGIERGDLATVEWATAPVVVSLLE